MKYYIIEKEIENIKIKTLCRIKNNKLEIYDYEDKPRGEWLESDYFSKIFEEHDDAYNIYEPNQEEIEKLKKETDEFAYDDYHESTGYLKDDKGKRHREYIYQDYRSIDGYCVEGGFESDIILNRKYNDYYFDEENDILIKVNKDTNKIYVFKAGKSNNYIDINWVPLNKMGSKIIKIVKSYNFDEMKPTKEYEKMFSYIYIKKVEKAKELGIDNYW